MLVAMILAALAVDGLFSLLGLIPTGPRPSRASVFGSIQIDYKLALNILGVVIFAALFWLTARRGVTDRVCGMKVDRAKAVTKDFAGQTFYFCSEHCLHAFEAEPSNYLGTRAWPIEQRAAEQHDVPAPHEPQRSHAN
jgi:YHS domain-containing protein